MRTLAELGIESTTEVVNYSFGRKLEDTTAVTAGMMNFQRDLTATALENRLWGNWARSVADGWMYLGSNLGQTYEDAEYWWFINGTLATREENPVCKYFDVGYNGFFWMEMVVREKKFGTISQRGQWVFMQIDAHNDKGAMPDSEVYNPTGLPRPVSQNQLSRGATDSTPYFELDYDNNGAVTATDVTQFLNNQ